jgi:uncharacterized protein (TIGR03083 family)
VDSRQSFLAAARAVAELAGRLDPADLARPGLGGWDVRALLGHTSRAVVTVITYLERPADQVDLPSAAAYVGLAATVPAADVEQRGVVAGDALGDDPVAAFTALVATVTGALAPRRDDEVIETIGGGMRIGDYLPTRTFELVVHGFDLSTATGKAVHFGDDVLGEVAGLAGRTAVQQGRGELFLRSVTGRTPFAPGFSIV